MNFRMHRRLSRPCVAQTVLAISAFAQAQPVFHAGTRLVQVDVVVRNKSGPVAGLKKEDFTLFDEGSPQQISVFSVITKHSNKHATPLSAGTVSNRLNRLGEEPASATVLLIDRLNTPIDTQPYANRRSFGLSRRTAAAKGSASTRWEARCTSFRILPTIRIVSKGPPEVSSPRFRGVCQPTCRSIPPAMP